MIRLFACMGLVLLGSLALFYITLFQILIWVWPGAEQVALFWVMVTTSLAGAALQCLRWYFTPKTTLSDEESLLSSLIDLVYQFSVKKIRPSERRQFDEWQSQLFRWSEHVIQLALYLMMGWLFVFEGLLLFVWRLLSKLPGKRKQG